jgi:hypothetical protein
MNPTLLKTKQMKSKDELIQRIYSANGLLNINSAMLEMAQKNFNNNTGLYFNREEDLKRLETRKAVELRLRDYIRNLTINLITKI